MVSVCMNLLDLVSMCPVLYDYYLYGDTFI